MDEKPHSEKPFRTVVIIIIVLLVLVALAMQLGIIKDPFMQALQKAFSPIDTATRKEVAGDGSSAARQVPSVSDTSKSAVLNTKDAQAPTAPSTVKDTAAPPNCTDTDGGLEYDVKGTLTDHNGVAHTDYCTHEPWADFTANLIEYTCPENGIGHVENGYDCPNGCVDGACVIPRIMYWGGKVNQHIDLSTGLWATDPDGISGADIGLLSYCLKWYPNTVSVAYYAEETTNTWMVRGNVGEPYTSTKPSYECVQA